MPGFRFSLGKACPERAHDRPKPEGVKDRLTPPITVGSRDDDTLSAMSEQTAIVWSALFAEDAPTACSNGHALGPARVLVCWQTPRAGTLEHGRDFTNAGARSQHPVGLCTRMEIAPDPA